MPRAVKRHRAACRLRTARRVRAVRHARECVGMVVGLTRALSERKRSSSSRVVVGLSPRDPSRKLGQRRPLRPECRAGPLHGHP